MNTSASEIKDSWTLLTLASLSKQLGMFQERFRASPSIMHALGAVEIELEELLFSTNVLSTSILMQLVKRLDEFRS